MLTNQEIIDAAERHAAGLHAQLSKPDWRPSRAHIEQARNSIAKLIDALRAAARPALPTREEVTSMLLEIEDCLGAGSDEYKGVRDILQAHGLSLSGEKD